MVLTVLIFSRRGSFDFLLTFIADFGIDVILLDLDDIFSLREWLGVDVTTVDLVGIFLLLLLGVDISRHSSSAIRVPVTRQREALCSPIQVLYMTTKPLSACMPAPGVLPIRFRGSALLH